MICIYSHPSRNVLIAQCLSQKLNKWTRIAPLLRTPLRFTCPQKPSIGPILSQFNPVQILKSQFFRIYFNNITQSNHRFLSLFFPGSVTKVNMPFLSPACRQYISCHLIHLAFITTLSGDMNYGAPHFIILTTLLLSVPLNQPFSLALSSQTTFSP